MKKPPRKVKILVVNDDHIMNQAWKRWFKTMFTNLDTIFAQSEREAVKIFSHAMESAGESGGTFDLIIMNALTKLRMQPYPASVGLVMWMRDAYGGNIIGLSTIPYYRRMLERAGCTAVMEKNFENASEFVTTLSNFVKVLQDAPDLYLVKPPPGTQ